MDNELLVKRCIKNDREAQHLFFKKFYGKMLAVSMRYFDDKEEAKDILQESFIKIFANLNRYQFTGSLDAWCRKVVINCAIDNIRKKKEIFISFSEIKDSSSIYAIKDDDNQNTDYFREVDADVLFRMVQKLPISYRTVFNLAAMEDYTHKEIAKELNIVEGTSKSLYCRAKQKLKIMIKNYQDAKRV